MKKITLSKGTKENENFEMIKKESEVTRMMLALCFAKTFPEVRMKNICKALNIPDISSPRIGRIVANEFKKLELAKGKPRAKG